MDVILKATISTIVVSVSLLFAMVYLFNATQVGSYGSSSVYRYRGFLTRPSTIFYWFMILTISNIGLWIMLGTLLGYLRSVDVDSN